MNETRSSTWWGLNDAMNLRPISKNRFSCVWEQKPICLKRLEKVVKSKIVSELHLQQPTEYRENDQNDSNNIDKTTTLKLNKQTHKIKVESKKLNTYKVPKN